MQSQSLPCLQLPVQALGMFFFQRNNMAITIAQPIIKQSKNHMLGSPSIAPNIHLQSWAITIATMHGKFSHLLGVEIVSCFCAT